MNQLEFIAITCNLLKAREKLSMQDVIALTFNWLKKMAGDLKANHWTQQLQDESIAMNESIVRWINPKA